MSGSRFVQVGRAAFRSLTGLAVAFGLLGFGAANAAAQNTGTVTGLVRDAVTLAPLAGAQVSVEGTGIGGLANNVGRFLLLNVPAGQQTIQVTLIGYTQQTQTVTVTAGQSTVADFSLREQALSLEGVVVTGTAGQARRREVGNQISSVGSADIELAAITNVSDILQGRSTGVQVADMGGQVGGGAQVRIRGNSSLTAGNDPLIYIDGVRIESNPIVVDDEAAASPQALDFINPNDIERVEIVKGPAATTLYGTEASGGVIQIFTKRGQAGAPAWAFSTDQGVRNMRQLYGMGGMNDKDINPTGYYMNDCSVHRGYNSTQAGIAPIDSRFGPGFFTLDSAQAGCPESGSWFRNAHMQKYNLSVRGGSENVTYFVSGRYDDEQGSIDPQGADSYGLRANLAFQPVNGLDINLNNSYQRRNIQWIPDGNNASGFMLNIVRGEAGYTPNNDDSKVLENDIISNIHTFQTSAGISWAPNSMWSHRVNAGLDYTVSDFIDWKFWDYYANPEGYRENDHDQDRNLTLDYNGSFSYDGIENISSRLSFGGQIYEEYSYGLFSDDQRFAGPGEPLVGDGTQSSTFEGRTRVRSGGFFLQEQIGWQDKLFVTGGVRWDGFSTFGEGFGLATYPKVSASYIISDESFFPTGIVDQFKLRAAWGRSGRAPGVFAAEKLWQATSADEQLPAVVLDNFGNADLGPELSTEFEWGFEASALDGRVSFEFTKYEQTTKDALIGVSPTPSTGTNNSVLRNLGEAENWGTESALSVVPLRTDDIEWQVGLQYSTNDSKITDLGELTDLGSALTLGWPLFIRYDDVLITCDNDGVRFADASTPIPSPCWSANDNYDPNNRPDLADRFLGRLFPTDMLSLSTRLTMWQSLTLDLLGEGQYGFVKVPGYAYQTMRRNQLDNPVWPYCTPILDVWNNGDRTTLTNQQVTECVPAFSDHGVWTQRGGDGDFFKLRSASLAYRLPEGLIPGTRSATVQVQAKNLFTITDYIGMDPETSDNGPTDQTPYDYYVTAPPRIFIFGLTVNF